SLSDLSCLRTPAPAERNAVCTLAARLDNRAELSDSLSISAYEQLNLSDASLVIRAFERWGEACPARLNGDWSLAVWSPATRRLFLARDHFGNTGLYYARCGERVAFSSDINAIVKLQWVPRRLNETRIASLLVGGGVDEPQSTVYRDIARVPPAHLVTITPGEERLSRYWRVEDTPDAGPSLALERVEVLRSTLRAAVSSRLCAGDPVGSMLSGGLDSGAVTAFAAEKLHGLGRRLTAFTSVPAFSIGPSRRGAGCPDEGNTAADLAQSFDSIDHVLVPARMVSPIAGIRRGLAIHGEPLIAAANYGWLTEIMADAQARGIKALLTGQVGDFVMAGRPAVHGWRRDLSEGRYRSMLRQLAPNWLLRFRQVEWQPWRLSEPAWRSFSVVNSHFAGEIRLIEQMRDAGRDPRHLKRNRPGRSAIVRQATSHVGAVWAQLGASYGLTVLDPLQDKRVMEQMFSGPRPLSDGGTDRWLFRQSLVGVVPEPVRLSRSKAMQSADIVERLLASWHEVEEALSLAEASPLASRCVDVPYCRGLAEAIRTAQTHPQARRQAFMLVNGLSAALFLAETWQS
ncbi:MAG: asparagine synthase-related protein, partial [Vicinamibacterales bacterium]